MTGKKTTPALLIIDVQQVLDHPDMGALNDPGAEQNIVRLLAHWRAHGLPLFFVKYLSPRKASPFHPDAPGSQIKDSVAPKPGEPVVIKHFEGAFMKTDLEERLKAQGIQTLAFTGFYADQCLAASAKAAQNLGFKSLVVADGTGSTSCRGYDGRLFEAEEVWQLTLGSLQRDGIEIVHTADLLAATGQ